MPEGPEIKKMVSDMIRPAFEGAVLEAIEGLSVSYVRGPWRTKAAAFQERFLPGRVTEVGRRGKQVWLCVDGADGAGVGVIGLTFGLRGQLTNRQTTGYQRVAFHIRGRKTPVIFDDQIGQGNVLFMTAEENERKLAKLGPDLFEMRFADFEERMGRKKWAAKAVVVPLMSQEVVAGVGNYVKAEALQRARISPHRKTRDLGAGELREIFDAIKWVGYRVEAGLNGKRVGDLMNVYGRECDPEGREVVREKTADGRTTHWVPGAQR